MTRDARRSVVPRPAPLALAAALWAFPAAAQPDIGVFAGASFGAHAGVADFVSGWSPSAGLFGGIAVNPWMDVELEWQRPTRTLRAERVGSPVSFAPPGASREEIDRLSVVSRFIEERRPRSLVSAGVSFHPDRHIARRATPRLFVGLTAHWVEDHTTLEHLVIPPGITQEQLDRRMPPQPPWQRNLGGITVGAGVALAVTPHLSIQPDIRYDYGSIGDEINNALRMTMRILWRSAHD
jgi:hypothetical protein